MSLCIMRIKIRTTCAALAASLLLIACQPPPRIEPTGLAWPVPPAQPRIKYLQSIYTEDDIGRIYTFREKLFGKDYYDGMARPYGVSARNGRLLVSDIFLRRVLLFDLEKKHLSNLGAEGGIRLPVSAVADSTRTMYIADGTNGKIAVYDPDGTYRTAYPLENAKPVGLAVNDALGRLYIVDRGGHRVIVLALDGTPLFEFGGRGTADGKLNIPLDLAIDRQGRVLVLDSGNFRVQIFTADGAFLFKFGMVGDRPGMFANPKGIATDSDGNIYVTDAAFCNFQIFDEKGSTLMFVGELGTAPGMLHLPGGIAVDEKDRIYVADQLNSRVQVFQYLKAAEPTATP